MRDFADTLEQRLMAMAVDVAEQSPEAVGEPRRERARRTASRTSPSRRIRSAFAGGFAATAAAIAAFFALGGTSLADLPILKTATTNASSIKSAVPSVAAKGVDFERAHVFHTPGGNGYVMTTSDQQTVCIAVPDPLQPTTFGASCRSPLSLVEREGLPAEAIGDRGTDANATSVIAFVLPENARNPRLIVGGVSKPLTPEAGVAVAEVSTAATVAWTVDGREATRRFAGPFAAATSYTCTSGTKTSVPSSEVPIVPSTPGRPAAPDLHALKRLCR